MSKIESSDPSAITHEVIAASGQIADIMKVKTNAGVVLFQIDKDGNVKVPGDVIQINGSALSAIFAPIAKGVTNGDSHDHSGGDGAQIAYSSLSGAPSLGDSAALNVGTGSGEVAAGDHAHEYLGPSSYMVYKDGSTVYVKNLASGAIEDSGTYLDAVLQSVIDGNTDGGGCVHIKAGEYTMAARLDVPSNWHIRGAGAGTIINGGFGMTGVETTVRSAMTSNPTQGGVVVSVVDASGFAAGDFVKLYGTGGNCLPPGTGASYSGNYEGSVIKSISGNDITLENAICNVYTTATSGAVMKITPVENVKIADMRIEGALTGDLIYGYWVKDVVIEGAELYGNLRQGIYLATAWNCTIRECWFEYTHDAINLEICAHNNTIVDCVMDGGSGNGVDIALSSSNNRIIRCTVLSCASQPGIMLEYNCSRNVVRDCYIRESHSGVVVYYASQHNVIDNCWIIDVTNNGVYINDNSHDNTVANCNISGSGISGISVQDSDRCRVRNDKCTGGDYGLRINASDYTQVSGGIFSDNDGLTTSRGIYVFTSNQVQIEGVRAEGNDEHGILLSTGCNYCIIRANVVIGNGLAGGTHTQDGIVVATTCTYNIIANNIVANSPRSEIRVHDAASVYNMILDNVVYGTHDVAIYSGASSRSQIERNRGYVTENRGRSTGTGAQQTIAHGLAVTPTQVILWNIESAAAAYQSAAADATNIYITADSGKDYGWEAKG